MLLLMTMKGGKKSACVEILKDDEKVKNLVF
jgi:hypothetical protein